jgi:branched-chain amino acid transport system permease protein
MLLVNKPRFFAFFTSCAVTLAVYFLFRKSEMGRIIRAVGQDRKMAGLLGIDIYRVYNLAFGMGAAIVGIAGVMLAPFYYIHPNVGGLFGIKAFIIVVLGGLGSISGAFLGGIIIGLIESVGAQFTTATFTEAFIYLIFLAVLFYRPSGLFGLKQEW